MSSSSSVTSKCRAAAPKPEKTSNVLKQKPQTFDECVDEIVRVADMARRRNKMAAHEKITATGHVRQLAAELLPRIDFQRLMELKTNNHNNGEKPTAPAVAAVTAAAGTSTDNAPSALAPAPTSRRKTVSWSTPLVVAVRWSKKRVMSNSAEEDEDEDDDEEELDSSISSSLSSLFDDDANANNNDELFVFSDEDGENKNPNAPARGRATAPATAAAEADATPRVRFDLKQYLSELSLANMANKSNSLPIAPLGNSSSSRNKPSQPIDCQDQRMRAVPVSM